MARGFAKALCAKASAMPDPVFSSYCREQLRRFDPDRYFCLLFAPKRARGALFALYAFNLEIAKLGETVREPMAGEIRLQWWRETIEAAYGGTARHHAVAEPLACAIARFAPARERFEALIEARGSDLSGEPPETLEALERYADATSGGLQLLALDMLEVADDAARDAARRIGIAWALAGLLRAVPFHGRAGRIYLPKVLMAEAALNAEPLHGGEFSDALGRIVRRIAESAEAHLAAARKSREAVPRAALPALLPAILADVYLKRLKRCGFDPFSARLAVAPLNKQLRVVAAAARGRY